VGEPEDKFVQPYGSITAVMLKSGGSGGFDPSCVVGNGRAIRIRPFDSSSEYADRLAVSVLTSSVSQVAPSFTRKIGSFPLLATNRRLIEVALTLHALRGSWQVAQARPLVPRLWKKGCRLVSVGPARLKLSMTPLESNEGRDRGMIGGNTPVWLLPILAVSKARKNTMKATM
jgi:hypothetical protein